MSRELNNTSLVRLRGCLHSLLSALGWLWDKHPDKLEAKFTSQPSTLVLRHFLRHRPNNLIMPFEVSRVIEVSELDELMEMDYEAWQTPYIPQLKHFRPSFPARAESIAFAKARKTKKLLENDPNCFFIKIKDTETQEVVGAATWIFNEASDDTDNDEKAKAEWYPEGSEEREFAECFIDGLSAFLAPRLTRAHMGRSFK
jgi:hypothetical protein